MLPKILRLASIIQQVNLSPRSGTLAQGFAAKPELGSRSTTDNRNGLACPRRRLGVFSFVMSETRCTACGAALIPGTGFCRQCGAPALALNEQPTAMLNPALDGTTHRLDGRLTNPYRDQAPANGLSQELATPAVPPGGRPRRFLFIAIVVFALLACAGLIGLLRSVILSRTGTHSVAQVNRALIYPNSRVVLDITQNSGGGVLQLVTSDPLDKVQSWYAAQLKPDKILQATISATIMKKDNVTATMVFENNSTTIIIKQSP